MSHISVSSNVDTSTLELKAIEQRRLIHNSVNQLRDQVKETVRETLDVERYAREYVTPVSGAVFLLSFFVGFGVAGTLKHIAR